MTDEARDSQQDPQKDSALQTPQPDQPHPPVQPDESADQPRVDSANSDRAEDSPPVEVNVNIDNPAAPAQQTESD